MSDKKTNIVFLLAFACLLCLPKAFAQDISIESFRLLENDLTANLKGSMRVDHNGETAALIKIVTAEQGFSFDGGMVGIVDTKQEVGEIWVWVPHGIKKISIRHPQLGVLRDYYFSIPIEKAKTYEMKLVSGQVKTVTNINVNQQYVVFHVQPSDAKVEINDEIVAVNSEGTASKRLSFAKYNYRVSAENYHTEAGTFTVSPNEKTTIEVQLKPNFGWINIDAADEYHGADIYINNDKIGKVPLITKALKSGSYSLSFVKPMYKNFNCKITVTDNDTSEIDLQMDANFSVVTLQASPQTEIWVEDDYKGSGHAEVKLEFGSYKVETRRQSHQSTSQLLQINGPIAQTIILKEPIPMYGSSSVETEPSGAKVFIDDIFRGETPVILNGILIGEHTIRFEKDGYAHKTQSINIEHNKTTLCHENLSKEACISFDANGGNGNMSPFIVTVGEEKRLPANRFSKENFSFFQWNTKADGSGIAYSNAQIINIQQDMVLYAQWEDRYVEVCISSLPNNARLQINGKVIGHTPYITALEVGEYDFSLTAKNHFPLHKKVEIHDNQNEYSFILKRQFFKPSSFYIAGEYNILGIEGVKARLGGYINNVNIEANLIYALKESEPIYWNQPSYMSYPCVYTYHPLYIGGNVGYGFIVLSRFRITPKMGAGIMKVRGTMIESGTHEIQATDGYSIPLQAGLGIDMVVAPSVAISINPYYNYAITKSELYKTLSNGSKTIESYTSGFSISAGINFYL